MKSVVLLNKTQNTRHFSDYIIFLMFHVVILWVMTLHSDVVQHQHFRGSCCLHLQGEVNGTGKGVGIVLCVVM